MLQEATTWQSGNFIRPSVLPGAIIPQPNMPTTIRSEGAGRPPRPMALEGMMVGNATAAPATPAKLKKWRRVMGLLAVGIFIKENDALASIAKPSENNQRDASGFRHLNGPDYF